MPVHSACTLRSDKFMMYVDVLSKQARELGVVPKEDNSTQHASKLLAISPTLVDLYRPTVLYLPEI